jgi:hypothetical protein
VRLIFLRLLDVELTTFTCLELASGSALPPVFKPLTNHPDGWSSVMKLFADFSVNGQTAPTAFHLQWFRMTTLLTW